MKKCVGHKIGDTLVEVALAIGIFSMVAIAVISVISGSTSSAQSTLETTVTREAIDVQAEALRFLQTAYISGGETGTAVNNYAKVWKAITARAERSNSEDTIKYAPTSCDEIYNGNNLINQKAFIIDTHQLSTLDPNKVILTPDKVSFTTATTYPRLIYGSRIDNPDETILGQDSGNVFYRAEGVYIVAVKDSKDTYLVAGDNVNKGSAYYDFYIRTCWYNPGAEIPSTISTVVRLYDPDVMPSKAVVKYEPNGGTGKMNNSAVYLGSPVKLTRNKFTREGYLFGGWCVDTPTCSSKIPNGGTYTPPDGTSNKTVKMYAQWNPVPYTLTYDANGGSYAPAAQTCYLSIVSNDCRVTSSEPSRSGYQFLGWSESPIASEASYTAGSIVNITGNKTLYAVWRSRNETITVTLNWSSSPRDLDSHVEGWKSDNSPFHAFYGTLVSSDISGLIIASLDHDDTDGYGPEIFKINTLGGKDYYYYVHNYSGEDSITNATVTVSGPYIGSHTYYASQASGSGRYWNVFAYKDGRIVYRGTRSSSPEIGY